MTGLFAFFERSFGILSTKAHKQHDRLQAETVHQNQEPQKVK